MWVVIILFTQVVAGEVNANQDFRRKSVLTHISASTPLHLRNFKAYIHL